ncbi:hypothetical protein LO772_23420 [Yinghuangia sp. ASG 101]|uniref:hypothetical protein n=1 Tax=Yinghuangia sp. ASG 101 TaxID=2896848 RepID=UPI001E42D1C6|nr:hypothetical protein [Yinghuangia sp. ASG 101]UGQ09836.1 hypothetical protein LO772_23420 [Yinghuangia sp. ASG 101]
MRVLSRSRSARGAIALAVAALFAAVSCSDGGGAKTAPDALSTASLQAALLTAGELPQGWELVGGGKAVTADEVVRADRSACQPVMDMVSGRSAEIAPTGQVDAGLLGPGEAEGASHLGINQYKEGEAAALLEAVRAALPGCASFGVVEGGGSANVVAIAPGQGPELGDAAVFFEVATVDASGGMMRIPHAIVRTGSALVITSTLNLPDSATVPIPEELLRAQVDKLAGMQRQARQA